MSKNVTIHNKFFELITTYLLPLLENKINDQIEFCQKFLDILSSFENNNPTNSHSLNEQYFQQVQELFHELNNLLLTRFTERKAQSFSEIYKDYDEACFAYLNSLRKNRKETQKIERFIAQPNDTRITKFVKFLKKLSFKVSMFPIKVRNSLGKLLKKEPVAEKTWLQTTPYRELSTLYFYYKLGFQLAPLYQKVNTEIAKVAEALWKIEDQIFFSNFSNLNKSQNDTESTTPATIIGIPFKEEIESQVKSLKKTYSQLKQTAKQEVSEIHKLYNEAYEKAGTFELTRRQIHRKLIKDRRELEKLYERNSLEWGNTLFALHEDWRIDQELNILSITTLNTYRTLQHNLHYKIIQQIIPDLTDAKNQIQSLLKTLPNPGDKNDKRKLKKIFIEAKGITEKELVTEILPAAVENLFRQQIPLIFDVLSDDFIRAVKEISVERGLVETKSYDHPIKSSEINFVSPYQIVAFESLPNLLESIEENKHQVSKSLIQIQQRIHEIGQIVYFNLDTAISALSSESYEGQTPFEIANEGLLRAIKSIEAISEDLIQIKSNSEKVSFDAITTFNHQLSELKNNNYALEIKFRIARAKAIERARAYREKILKFFRNIIPYSIKFVDKTYHDAADVLKVYQRKIGIETTSESVTTEISDYLSATESAINRLPYVYQRLFKIQALEDEIFFEERKLELDMLNEAFKQWKHQRYACAVLIGEKGSGITTLINFFIKRQSKQDRMQFSLIFANSTEQLWMEEDFFRFFNKIFSKNSFENLEDIAQHLNNLEDRYIIVIEHIEQWFLKKIGGFVCLQLLFELISKTNKQVFWLSSSTLYSWQYLDKTMHISDYFEYVITLQNIANEKMREVILKRHRVSGYSLQFVPPDNTKEKKKYNKMSLEEQQAHLKETYFADLNRITSGNCGLAQLFWMRSAEEVTDDTITIGSLKELDFSFIRSISLTKTIILHMLLLHNGLTEGEYAIISNQLATENQAKILSKARLDLLQLLDDGLIVKENNNYYINPLLYRPIVSLLKTKNFLH